MSCLPGIKDVEGIVEQCSGMMDIAGDGMNIAAGSIPPRQLIDLVHIAYSI